MKTNATLKKTKKQKKNRERLEHVDRKRQAKEDLKTKIVLHGR